MQANSRGLTIAAWAIAVRLFVAFIGARLAKLSGQAMMVAEYASFRHPLRHAEFQLRGGFATPSTTIGR